MGIAWVFTFLGLGGLSVLFDKKATISMKIFFGIFGALYAIVGIWLIIILWK